MERFLSAKQQSILCESGGELAQPLPYRASPAVARAGQEVQGALSTLNKEVISVCLG